MSARPLYVRAMGMACPVGLTATSACAAIRAGIERKQELPYKTDAGHVPNGSFLPSLGDPEYVVGRRRWLQLLRLALHDLRQTHNLRPWADRPLILALPQEATVHRAWLLAALSEDLQTSLDPTTVHILCEGPSGGYRALALARTLLIERKAMEVVVCAADSLISARRLLDLDRNRRLLHDDNSDGVIPGEAAAALVVDLQARGAKGAIRGMGFGQEPGLLHNDIPLRGEGIVAATRAALREAGLSMHHMDVRLSDAAGEAYHFKEQVIVISRLLRNNKDSFPLWLGAMTLGDTGAAAGLCNLLVALQAYERGRFPGIRAIAYAGSDEGRRSAVIVEEVQS